MNHCGRAVLAINCVLGGAEWAPSKAAQLDRYTSLNLAEMHSPWRNHLAVYQQRGGFSSALNTLRGVASVRRGVVVACSAAAAGRQVRAALHTAPVSGMVVPKPTSTYNFSSERTVVHRGPRLAAASAAWPAAQFNR